MASATSWWNAGRRQTAERANVNASVVRGGAPSVLRAQACSKGCELACVIRASSATARLHRCASSLVRLRACLPQRLCACAPARSRACAPARARLRLRGRASANRGARPSVVIREADGSRLEHVRPTSRQRPNCTALCSVYTRGDTRGTPQRQATGNLPKHGATAKQQRRAMHAPDDS
eukprot:1353101-Alexandrium_andersonii.AAC.1